MDSEPCERESRGQLSVVFFPFVLETLFLSPAGLHFCTPSNPGPPEVIVYDFDLVMLLPLAERIKFRLQMPQPALRRIVTCPQPALARYLLPPPPKCGFHAPVSHNERSFFSCHDPPCFHSKVWPCLLRGLLLPSLLTS